MEAWLEHAYPKDENGVSIRHQIDKTIKSEEQFVADIKSGKICKLAAQAFQTHTKFNPPPYAAIVSTGCTNPFQEEPSN